MAVLNCVALDLAWCSKHAMYTVHASSAAVDSVCAHVRALFKQRMKTSASEERKKILRFSLVSSIVLCYYDSPANAVYHTKQ